MKNNNILKSLILMMLVLPFVAKSAQVPYVKQVIVVNGGIFQPGNHITLVAHNPVTKKDSVFDSIPGRSVTQILIDTDGMAYVATDSILVKYNLNTLKKVTQTSVYSIRYIALYKDKICATIGDDGNFNNFKMFSKSNLTLLYKERNIKTYCEGLAVVGDSAYVSMQGLYPYIDSKGRSDTGKIAVIDLVNMKFKRVIYLDTLTKGIEHIFAGNGYIVATTENFLPTFSYISKIDLKTGAKTIKSQTELYTPFALYDDSLYAGFPKGIGSYNLKSATSKLYIQPRPDYANAALDTLNKRFYVTGNDFSAATKTYIYSYTGKLLDSFKVGISPQAIAIQYGMKSGIEPTSDFGNEVRLYPNPAKTAVFMNGINAAGSSISVIDITGKLIYSVNKDLFAGQTLSIPVEGLPNGIYIINVKSALGSFSRKFDKE